MIPITITIEGSTTQNEKAAETTLGPHIHQFLKQLEVSGCAVSVATVDAGEEFVDLSPTPSTQTLEEKQRIAAMTPEERRLDAEKRRDERRQVAEEKRRMTAEEKRLAAEKAAEEKRRRNP